MNIVVVDILLMLSTSICVLYARRVPCLPVTFFGYHSVMEYDEPEEPEDFITRGGYQLRDLVRAFHVNLTDPSLIASGRLIRFTADLIASRGMHLWEKILWDFSFSHIGIASPRIFHYLERQFKSLQEKAEKYSLEAFCRMPEIQKQCAEIPLVVQMAPKKPKPKIPTVPAHVHLNEDWLRSVLQTTDRDAVLKVWQRSTDMEQMRHAGNELCYSIMEGSLERALFWVRWLLEEDALTRKTYQAGLSTAERGPAQIKGAQKTGVGYYLVAVMAEIYKNLAQKGMVRLHTEFQALLDIYRVPQQTQKRKMDTMVVMVQILCEVPRWKVPAAPSLVTDTGRLDRMISQADVFFREVMHNPLPPTPVPKTVTGLRQKKVKPPSKEDALQQRLEEMDKAVMGFYKM
jgi:hypothetical protein